jgi:hypothetical protein
MKIKSTLLILCCVTSFLVFGCKSDKNPDDKDPITEEKNTVNEIYKTLKGEFIHVDTAAVLRVENNLYGVKMDEMAKSVIKKAENIKSDDYDVINVIIKGEISPNPEIEGWKEIVTIKSLDKIYKPAKSQQVKISN